MDTEVDVQIPESPATWNPATRARSTSRSTTPLKRQASGSKTRARPGGGARLEGEARRAGRRRRRRASTDRTIPGWRRTLSSTRCSSSSSSELRAELFLRSGEVLEPELTYQAVGPVMRRSPAMSMSTWASAVVPAPDRGQRHQVGHGPSRRPRRPRRSESRSEDHILRARRYGSHGDRSRESSLTRRAARRACHSPR